MKSGTHQKSVLITGCNRGIGRSTLELLDRHEDYVMYGLVRESAEKMASLYPGIDFFNCDLSNPEETEDALKNIQQVSGGIDIVISNAGHGLFKSIENLKLEEWHRTLHINLTATFLLLHTFIPSMKKRNFGKIVILSSDAELFSYIDASAYCASKAGLKLLADCARKETDGYNIHITTIAPGRVDTYFNKKKPGQRPNSLKAEDIAAQIEFVLSQPERVEIEQLYLNSNLEKSLH